MDPWRMEHSAAKLSAKKLVWPCLTKVPIHTSPPTASRCTLPGPLTWCSFSTKICQTLVKPEIAGKWMFIPSNTATIGLEDLGPITSHHHISTAKHCNDLLLRLHCHLLVITFCVHYHADLPKKIKVMLAPNKKMTSWKNAPWGQCNFWTTEQLWQTPQISKVQKVQKV